MNEQEPGRVARASHKFVVKPSYGKLGQTERFPDNFRREVTSPRSANFTKVVDSKYKSWRSAELGNNGQVGKPTVPAVGNYDAALTCLASVRQRPTTSLDIPVKRLSVVAEY